MFQARLEEGEFLNDSLVDYRLRFFQARGGGGGGEARVLTPSAPPSRRTLPAPHTLYAAHSLRRTLPAPQEELKSLDPEMFKRCHFFNSFFYKRLLQTMQGGQSAKDREDSYQQVRRWTKRAAPPPSPPLPL